MGNSQPNPVQYSIASSQPPESGFSAVYQNLNFTSNPQSLNTQNIGQTVYSLYQSMSEKYSEKPFLGSLIDGQDSIQWITYEQASTIVTLIASGFENLEKIDFQWENLRMVGIYAQSSPQWILLDWACTRQNITSVSIIPGDNIEQLCHICEETEIRVLVIDKDKVEMIRKVRDQGRLQMLSTLIIIQEEAEIEGLQVLSLNQLIELGQDQVKPDPGDQDSIYSILYTTSTLGKPIGAMLSHRNMISAVIGVPDFGFVPTSNDLHFSFLPLAHIYERFCSLYLISYGVSIGYFSGNMKALMQDMKRFQPTIFIAVPRILDKLLEEIQRRLSIFENQAMYQQVLDVISQKKQRMVNSFREMLGGRVRIVISGGAPLANQTQELLKSYLGCPIVQGYGSTESSGGLFISHVSDSGLGHVGGPSLQMQFCLKDYANYQYNITATEPQGQLVIRGPLVFYGYFKNQQATNEILLSNGWLETGDIVRLNQNGSLTIIDRIQPAESQQEHINLQSLESSAAISPFVNFCVIFCDDKYQKFVAIIVLNQQYVEQWMEIKGIKDVLFENVRELQELKDEVLLDLRENQKKNGVPEELLISDVFLEVYQWQPDGDLITHAMMMKRRAVKERYQEVISNMLGDLKISQVKFGWYFGYFQ